MDQTEIIKTIDAEIARLEKARALLNDHVGTPVRRGRAVGTKRVTTAAKPQRRKMSPEGRARIAEAQRRRWSKARKG